MPTTVSYSDVVPRDISWCHLHSSLSNGYIFIFLYCTNRHHPYYSNYTFIIPTYYGIKIVKNDMKRSYDDVGYSHHKRRKRGCWVVYLDHHHHPSHHRMHNNNNGMIDVPLKH